MKFALGEGRQLMAKIPTHVTLAEAAEKEKDPVARAILLAASAIASQLRSINDKLTKIAAK